MFTTVAIVGLAMILLSLASVAYTAYLTVRHLFDRGRNNQTADRFKIKLNIAR
jgi:hypothetical protein